MDKEIFSQYNALRNSFNASGRLLVEAKKQQLNKFLGSEDLAVHALVQEMRSFRETDTNVVTWWTGRWAEFVPSTVPLQQVIDASASNARFAFLNGLSAGRQTVQSLNNEYTVTWEISPAQKAAVATDSWINANDTGNIQPTTARVNLNMKKLVAKEYLDANVMKFSLVQAVSEAIGRCEASLMIWVADSILNWDSTTSNANINLNGGAIAGISNWGANSAKLLHWNGIRYWILNATPIPTEAVTAPSWISDFIDVYNKLSFGGSYSDYMIVTNNQTLGAYMKHNDFKNYSVNNSGSSVNWVLAKPLWMDLYTTDLLALTHTDWRVSNTATNNTKGSFLIVKKNSIQHGTFGVIEYQIEQDIETGVLVKATVDFGFDNLNGKVGKIVAGAWINVTV